MKKIGKIVKGNLKLVIGIIIGATISGVTVYAATVIASSNVSYSNTTSGLSATNVQSAIDELYTRANTWIDPSYIDFGTLATNGTKTVLASKNGVCIIRNNKVSCLKNNNYEEEKNHIKQVFPDGRYTVYPSGVGSYDSDFDCSVDSNGRVECRDQSNYSGCSVDSAGSVDCY